MATTSSRNALILFVVSLLAFPPTLAAASLFDTYLEKSEDALRQGDASKAAELAKSAEAEAKLSNNDQGRINALYVQAQALRALGNFRESERIVMQCLSDSGATPDDSMLARLNFTLGSDLMGDRRWAGAEKALRKSLDIVESSPDLRQRLRAKIISSLAIVYEQQGKTAQAEALKSTVPPVEVAQPAATAATTASLLIVLDCSAQADSQLRGMSSIELAKQSIDSLMARIPPTVNIGLRVIGGAEGGDECTNTKLLVPIGTANRSQIMDAVHQLKPSGKCPLVYGLTQAFEHDIPPVQGPKSLLLFAVGHDECRDMPSEINSATAPINFISIGSTESAEQFRHIALGTNGNTWDAYDLRRFLVSDLRFNEPVTWPPTFERKILVVKEASSSSILHVPIVKHTGRPSADEPETLSMGPTETINMGPETLNMGSKTLVPGPEAKAWLNSLCEKVTHAWLPPKGSESKQVMLVFDVQKQGEISNVRFKHSSGNEAADQAATSAIKSVAPLEPLPAALGEKTEVQFTFLFNIYGLGGHAEIVDPNSARD